MISVVVPVYKAEKVVARCIESVIAQEYKDWELILVDDGSPDRSGEICDEYAEKDARIRVIHQKNAGASAARNHGMDEAKGKYICFIDADDYVTERYLADFKGKENEVDFAVQGMTLTYGNSQRETEYMIPAVDVLGEINSLLQQKSVHTLLLGPCCKLFRKVILQKHCVRFPEKLSYSEDGVFVLDYLCHAKGMVRASACSNYIYTHEASDSLTSSFHSGEELYLSVLTKHHSLIEMCRSFGFLPEEFVSFYRRHLAIDLYQSIYNKWIDKRVSAASFIRFIWNMDKQLVRFIYPEERLPNGFKVLRFLLSFKKFII